MNIRKVNFESYKDHKGEIWVIDNLINQIFIPRRIFRISNVPKDTSRGNHAHLVCEQFIIATKGNCRVKIDNGFEDESIILEEFNFGILLPKLHWIQMYNFSANCELLVLASEIYDDKEIISDYKIFSIYARSSDRK